MPRPPAEIRRLEEEKHRRERAHRWVWWERRLRVALWILGGVALLVAIALLGRLAGFSLR